MGANCYLKPAREYNGSIKTDLPLIVTRRAKKKEVAEAVMPGQLLCVGKVYFKTPKGLIRIK